jgi:hypothetical protein
MSSNSVFVLVGPSDKRHFSSVWFLLFFVLFVARANGRRPLLGYTASKEAVVGTQRTKESHSEARFLTHL